MLIFLFLFLFLFLFWGVVIRSENKGESLVRLSEKFDEFYSEQL